MTATQALLFSAIFLCSVDLSSSFQSILSQTKNSRTHINITQTAILRKTAEVCRDIAASKSQDFRLTIDDSLSAEDVQKACSSADPSTSTISTFNLLNSIVSIILGNVKVDQDFAQNPSYHFHNEAFQEGRDLITKHVDAVKKSVKDGNYPAARQNLGQALHTLQDFYSHSNWVELGNNAPYSALIKPGEPLTNIAGPSIPRCSEGTLTNSVQLQRLLTSGYFNTSSSEKPSGKCSHGGLFDLTSMQGINKDEKKSSHGNLHAQAADLAVNATMELLEDIRSDIGDDIFLRFMGLQLSKVLCLVIDTTSSMSDDITAVKKVAEEIIKMRRGTQLEPPAYILIPFNDPDFGPVTMTTDADVFLTSLDNLRASGGGDTPEMSLSGLELALRAAPPYSEIFVFTDAPAKASDLKSTITALIESSKSVVTFLLTGSTPRRWRHVHPRLLTETEVQLYRDLATESGGLAIEVSKEELSHVIDILSDSSNSAVVTVFRAIRNDSNTFTFPVDSTIRGLIVYITGAKSLTFTVTSPTDVTQSSRQSSGPLGSLTTVGNFFSLKLRENQAGMWKISVNSNTDYSVKVTGNSYLHLIYQSVERRKGAHGDFVVLDGRPIIGGIVNILIFVTESASLSNTEVFLTEVSSGSTQVKGSLQLLESNIYLATFAEVPDGTFVLLLRGNNDLGSFQRQGNTQIQTFSIPATEKRVIFRRSATRADSTTSTVNSCICSTTNTTQTVIPFCSINDTPVGSPSNITVTVNSPHPSINITTVVTMDTVTTTTDNSSCFQTSIISVVPITVTVTVSTSSAACSLTLLGTWYKWLFLTFNLLVIFHL